MATSFLTGRNAENIACQYLQQQGLQIITRNYLCLRGEIDIIAQHGEFTVFVEVRYRKNINFGNPLETVTRKKQIKLIVAASYYLQRHKQAAKGPSRFDVIAITKTNLKNQIEWVQNAFDA